jgi:hypothetical protein
MVYTIIHFFGPHMHISTMEGCDQSTTLMLIYGKVVCRQTALRHVIAVDGAYSRGFYAKAIHVQG